MSESTETTISKNSSEDFYNIFDNLSDVEFSEVLIWIEDLFNEYMNLYSIEMKNYKFNDSMIKGISEEMYIYWLDSELCSESSIEAIYCFVESIIYSIFLKYNIPNYVTFDLHHFNDINENNIIEKRLSYLNSIEQEVQKSDAWYKLRNNIISASSIWKLFRSETIRKNYIQEKVNSSNKYFNNIYSPSMEWGNKYEPVSIMIYKDKFNTEIGEYGCILHDDYNFIGASPDGINIKKGNYLYGRMLEIKNIYNRFITGIPKEEYWIQMQLQMETCNLEFCDFLETRFKEYSETEFYNDTIHQYKGVILHFSKNISEINNKNRKDMNVPMFTYYPINKCLDYEDINNWIQKEKEKYNEEYILCTTLYWYLDELSCVLVKRNKKWFNTALPIIKDSWNKINEIKNNNNGRVNVSINDNNNYQINNLTINKSLQVIKM